jgi:glycosyltransferase involved in cell wall biosynthesis
MNEHVSRKPNTIASPEPRAMTEPYRIAVLIPCHNEERTIGSVVANLRAQLPGAVIHVYDNNSSDGTVREAKANGAIVGYEKRQGKGHVVRRMFRDIDADIYVLVDGDATYDPESAPRLVAKLIDNGMDMVIGTRVGQDRGAYRPGHLIGGRMLTAFCAAVFGAKLRDMLSGYRILSRRFVKSFPALSAGFEIETELTIHALELELPILEVDTPYFARPCGSASKLNTWGDGMRILFTIVQLYRSERPLPFFTIIGGLLALSSTILAIPIMLTYIETGLVPRLPTAVLSTGLMILAFLSVAVGFVLDTVTRGRREMKLLAYLAERSLQRRD